MSIFSAVHKLVNKRRRKYRYEVIRLTEKEKSALAAVGGSLVTVVLVTTIVWITS